MFRGKKLGVLLRTYEAAEKTALQSRNEIEQVVDDRRQIVERLRLRRNTIAEKVKSLLGSERIDAVQSGNVSHIASLTSYTKRLQKELDALQLVVAEKEQALTRAVERAEMADEELTEARVERKKLEQLIQAQQKIATRKSIARSEADADELNIFRRKFEK